MSPVFLAESAMLELVVAKSWYKWSNYRKKVFALRCLQDDRETSYRCSYDKYLGFRVYCGDTVVVESVPRRKPKCWVWLSRPREFQLLIEGSPRGEIRRSVLGAFVQDRLMLDGHEYRIPDRLRKDAGGIGVRLRWVNNVPRATVRDEENLNPAIAILCFVMIRWLVVEG